MCKLCKHIPEFVASAFPGARVDRAAFTPEAWHMWTVQVGGCEPSTVLLSAVTMVELTSAHVESATEWMMNVGADRFVLVVEAGTRVSDAVRDTAMREAGEIVEVCLQRS